jgi:hypothetical protein
MRVWLSPLLLLVLVIGGLPRLCWGGHVAELFGDDNPSMFAAEALDERDEDQMAGSMIEDFHSPSLDNSLAVAAVSSKACAEPHSSKNNLTIYTLNRAFLI